MPPALRITFNKAVSMAASSVLSIEMEEGESYIATDRPTDFRVKSWRFAFWNNNVPSYFHVRFLWALTCRLECKCMYFTLRTFFCFSTSSILFEPLFFSLELPRAEAAIILAFTTPSQIPFRTHSLVIPSTWSYYHSGTNSSIEWRKPSSCLWYHQKRITCLEP